MDQLQRRKVESLVKKTKAAHYDIRGNKHREE